MSAPVPVFPPSRLGSSRPSVLRPFRTALLLALLGLIPPVVAASAESTSPQASASPHLPHLIPPPGYASSSSCAECHRDQHASWFQSYHRSMTQVASTNSVVADFNDVRLVVNGERFTLRRRGNTFWVEVEDLSPNAPKGEPARFPIELVTGSHHMQVFWLPAGAGNAQIGFPFTWLIRDRRWVPRDSTFIRDPHSPQQIETWNMTCIRCHVTAGQPRPRRDQGIFDTRAADLGIACEACHGPAQEHVDFQRRALAVAAPSSAGPTSPAANPPPPRPRNTNDPIVLPTRLDHVRASQVCAQCHGMKWFDTSENWPETGFRYRPGDDLEATTPIIRPGLTNQQPWVKRVLERSPQLLSEFFWPDGMIRVAGREFNGLVESACYQKGQLSCTSCHSLHEYADRNDQLKRGMDGNRACTGCHAEARYGPGHTHHVADSSGSLCYNCHLPHTTYALLGAIRQHQIDSPRIATTLRTGRPDACTLCHVDQTLHWADERLAQWYGHPRSTLTDEQKRISATAQLLLVGDAGQRALAAWHLGWEPARRVAGNDWQAPLLAHVLRDPYAAVRYIAHQSLRSLPGYERVAFDHVAEGTLLVGASISAIDRWKPSTRPRPPEQRRQLLLAPGGGSDSDAIEKLLSRRNDRPMRLRE